MSDSSNSDLSRIVRAEIHPAIGVGRVGNATSEYYLTPQVSTPAPRPPHSYRDATGAIKREAVQFRIYGYDAGGEVVAELTADNAEIEWQAHIANLKSAWYEFSVALDLKQAKDIKMPRRNPNVVDPEDRAALIIDPGLRSISSKNQEQGARFDSGTFMGEKVYLGELRTDDAGRLLVLGGHGVSNSPTGMPAFNPAQNNGFGNAIGWHDDTSDGPVDATVTINGSEIPVEGAWVAFGPPKFAPDIIGWRTMYELLEELFIKNAMLDAPTKVSFTKHVYPILQRLSGLQWVNAGFATMFGADGPLNFENPSFIDKLCRIHGERDAFGGLRREIYNSFRPAQDNPGANPRTWPWLYGDAFGSYDDDLSAEIYLLLPDLLEKSLKAWMLGDFVADWAEVAAPPQNIDQVPLAEQPMSLTKASLHFCAADAFHPGIELTWPMRHITMYQAPFRIKRNKGGLPQLDFGSHLTQDIALAVDGPLNAQGPGGLTRWMLVPWQVDTAGCRSGYTKSYDSTIPTFWPAHVPNQVLTEEDYQTLMNTSNNPVERRNAFLHRESWYATMPTHNSKEQLSLMVSYFSKMGIIEARPGPTDLDGVPTTIYVQTVPKELEKSVQSAASSVRKSTKQAAATHAAQQAGFKDENDRKDMKNIRFQKP
ncbi:LodA/GoxA family CTQ-dependent oxidase [Rubritalea spongiae]|uniref:LodA/GoxA family CTQ-dependent oxidase n=1 Tax=Rubritalea spongiae TaxID=430797 RepID=A0ABW5E0C9_9BACT